MSARLDTIVAATRRRVLKTRRDADLRALERAAVEHQPRGLRRRLVEAGESVRRDCGVEESVSVERVNPGGL